MAVPDARRPTGHLVDNLPPGLADHPDYEILRELGRGGMGVVYLAKNKLMGRLEVLKVVGGHLANKPAVLDRFIREIQSAARLQHKNIVSAYSALRVGESIILAMEYVEGEDLAKVVKSGGQLPVANACYYIYQAALGLQHAHERGMVHRDIKPANLILASDGKKKVVKVLDFGLAKVTSEGEADSGLTSEGQMLGTPDYISPEQIRDAQKADIRADIYSLGCTFYYLLTGGPPFRASKLWDLYQAHFSMDADPLNRVRPEVSSELAALVAKMLAKDPDLRFQTPGDVAQSLTRFFKPGTATGSGSNHEIRQVVVAAPPPQKAETPAPEPTALGGLIEIKDTEGSISGVRSRSASGLGSASGSRKKTGPIVVAASLFGLIAAGGVAYTLQSNKAETANPGSTSRPAETHVGTQAPAAVAATEPESSATDSIESPVPPKRKKAAVPTKKRPSVSRPAVELEAPAVVEVAPEPKAPVALASTAPLRVPPVVAEKAPDPPGVIELTKVKSRPGELHLLAKGMGLPPGPFWPEISPAKIDGWRIADPSAIAMNAKGIVLSAGPGGNYLITAKDNFKKSTIIVEIEADKGTEAYVVLKANDGAGAWHAITSRIDVKDGQVRVGHQALDFQENERGIPPRQEYPIGKKILIKLELNDKENSRVFVRGTPTSSDDLANGPANDWTGAAGVFVKSGSLLILSLQVR